MKGTVPFSLRKAFAKIGTVPDHWYVFSWDLPKTVGQAFVTSRYSFGSHPAFGVKEWSVSADYDDCVAVVLATAQEKHVWRTDLHPSRLSGL